MKERLGSHNGSKSSLDGIASLLVALIGPAVCALKIMIKRIQMNNDHRLRVTLLIVSLSIVMGCLGGCVTARKVDSSTMSKYEGFIHDGKTTKQEVLDRLGPAQSDYESGRIFIYHVYLQDDGRMTLDKKGTCHACVLVFDADNVLERHSLVKYGCP